MCAVVDGPRILDYFNFETKENLFEIRTTAELAKLDEITPRQTDEILNVYISCSLICLDETIVVSLLNAIKSNCHSLNIRWSFENLL